MIKDFYYLECKRLDAYKKTTPKAFAKKINSLKYTEKKDEEKNESSELHFSKTTFLGSKIAVRETISHAGKRYHFLSFLEKVKEKRRR